MDEPSGKQLGFLRALKDQLKLDDAKLGELISEVTRDPDLRHVENLGRRQASEVIDELLIRAKEKGIDLDASAPRASEKQVGYMLSLKRRAHLTDVEFAALLDDVAGVKDPKDVSKRDASQVIDRLLATIDEAKPAGAKTSSPSKSSKKPAGGKRTTYPKVPLEPRDDGPPEREPPPEAADDDDLPF
jgi:hypothetical protein